MTYGEVPLLDGLALLCGFVPLVSRRAGALGNACAVQSTATGLAVVRAGWDGDTPLLLAAGMAILLIQAVLLPALLRAAAMPPQGPRTGLRTGPPKGPPSRPGALAALAIGLCLLVSALLSTRDGSVSVALAIALLALLALAIRPGAVPRLCGLAMLNNAVTLGLLAAGPASPRPALLLAALVIPALGGIGLRHAPLERDRPDRARSGRETPFQIRQETADADDGQRRSAPARQ